MKIIFVLGKKVVRDGKVISKNIKTKRKNNIHNIFRNTKNEKLKE